MTREQALRELRRLVVTLRECEPEAAAARLLERVAGAEPEIRDVLLEVGARAALRGELELGR